MLTNTNNILAMNSTNDLSGHGFMFGNHITTGQQLMNEKDVTPEPEATSTENKPNMSYPIPYTNKIGSIQTMKIHSTDGKRAAQVPHSTLQIPEMEIWKLLHRWQYLVWG